jgi:hypothetical protein
MPLMNSYRYRVAGSMLLTRGPDNVELRDLRDPKALRTFPIGRDDGMWVMKDGRQVIAHYGRPVSVDIVRDGVRQHVVRFGDDVESVRIAEEIGDHRLLVAAVTPSRNERFDTTTYLLDANNGTLSGAMPHVFPAPAWGVVGMADPATTFRALLHRQSGQIDVMSVQSGAMRPLRR